MISTFAYRDEYQFTAKEYDEETGLYYMSARYMNPTTSRWASSDPAGWELINPNRDGFSIIESMNPYSYCSNNPINYTDPTGFDGVSPKDWFTPSQMRYTLKTAQNTAMNSPIYKRGSKGPMNYAKAKPSTTWCNQATYAIARKTGFNLDHFRSPNKTNLNDTNANEAVRNLRANAADKKSSLTDISAGEAMTLANKGFTVIAGWENPDNEKSGHIATVSTDQTGSGEVTIANVGKKNGEMLESDAFSNHNNVEYFYDPKQEIMNQDLGYKIGDQVQ